MAIISFAIIFSYSDLLDLPIFFGAIDIFMTYYVCNSERTNGLNMQMLFNNNAKI